MLGIFLMIIGAAIFGSGAYLYATSKSSPIEIAQSPESTIYSTPLDSEVDKDNGAVEQEIVAQNPTKPAKAVEVTASKNIDEENKKKGEDFEKFVVKKFDQKYFNIKEWASDKYVDGIYAESNQNPDLRLEFNHKQTKEEFSVECKYRSSLYNGMLEFAYPDQFKRYQQYEKSQKIPVFIVVGIGGEPTAPAELYVIPLRLMDSHKVQKEDLKEYAKDVDANFFYAFQDNILK